MVEEDTEHDQMTRDRNLSTGARSSLSRDKMGLSELSSQQDVRRSITWHEKRQGYLCRYHIYNGVDFTSLQSTGPGSELVLWLNSPNPDK
jgi:hypothetical protein